VARLPARHCDVPDRAVVQRRGRHSARLDRSQAGRSMTDSVLSVEGVSVTLRRRAALACVDKVDLTLAAGRTLGIVGESGCGKPCCRAPSCSSCPSAPSSPGRIAFNGRDLLALPPGDLRGCAVRSWRGLPGSDDLAQPVLTIAPRSLRRCRPISAWTPLPHPARGRAAAEVGIPAPEQRLRSISAPALGRHAPARGDRHRRSAASPGC